MQDYLSDPRVVHGIAQLIQDILSSESQGESSFEFGPPSKFRFGSIRQQYIIAQDTVIL